MDRELLGKLDKSELITLILALNARVAALEARLNIPPGPKPPIRRAKAGLA